MAFLVTGFVVFHNTFGAAWTLDDLPVVVRNTDIRSLAGFMQNSFPGRPIRELSYMLDYKLFGLEPFGYHIQNVLFHGLNAFLLYRVVSRLVKSALAAWGAAFLFLVHPVVVEVVANVGHRKDSLMLFFCLMALWLYIRGVEEAGRGRLLRLAGAGLCVLLACLTKQTAVVLPVALIFYEFCFLPPEDRLILKRDRWLWFAAAAAVCGVVGWFLYKGGGSYYHTLTLPLLNKANYTPFSLTTYGLVVLKSWSYAWLKLVWPADLAVEYVFAQPAGLGDVFVLGSLVMLLLVAVAAYRWGKHDRTLLFFLVWAVIFYLPVANLWPGVYFVADRYLYAPLAGVSVLLAVGCVRLLEGRSGGVRKAAAALGCAVLAGGAVLSLQQNLVWRTPESLWKRAVEVSPDSIFAHISLGDVYEKGGRFQPAKEEYLKALMLNPAEFSTRYHLVELYMKMGDVQALNRLMQKGY